MNLNLYSTLTLLQAIDKIMSTNTFFRDTFFPGQETFVTENILVDFRKSRRKMAPFVAPRSKGVSIQREGYRTDNYTPPKVAPQRPITVDDIVLRGMGESVFSQRTPADRQVELLAKDMAEFIGMMDRREEWMASQLICGGVITMYGFSDRLNTNIEISSMDFGFTNTAALLTTARWGQTTATIYQNLHDWRLQTVQASGKSPTMCILGDSAYTAFINDADIQKKMGMFTGQIVVSQPSVKNDALIYVATIPGLGLEVYTYSDWFVDESDQTEKPFVPVNGCVLGRPNMGGFRYGAVTQLENGQFVTIEGKRVPKSWADEDADTRMLRISSRPIVVPEDVSDWFYGTVL